MLYRHKYLVLRITLLFSMPVACAWGQIGSGRSSTPSGRAGVAAPRGISGVRGLSSPRSGLGFRSNTIANPEPSLTPHEVFNPPGSLSPGQLLNPAPSLQRPRSGGNAPMLRPGTAAGSINRDVRFGQSFRTMRQPVMTTPTGEGVRRSALALERRLTKDAPDKGWEKYLSLETLRKVRRSSEQPSETDRAELQSLLERYESVAAEEKYKSVSSLPEFQNTVGSLQEYLMPMEKRRRLDLGLSFDLLGEQLREYGNGESWAKHLALPKELLSDAPTKGVSASTRTLMKRFDRVRSNPTYAEITALPAFMPAYETLKQAVDPMDTLPPPSDTVVREQSVSEGETPRGPQPSVGAGSELPATDPAPPGIPLGERILEAVVELDLKLAKVAPGSEWPKRLSLDLLRVAVSVSSEQPENDSDRKSMEDVLKTYQAVAKNDADGVVNQLPEFKATLQTLNEYLKPRDEEPPMN